MEKEKVVIMDDLILANYGDWESREKLGGGQAQGQVETNKKMKYFRFCLCFELSVKTLELAI